MSGEKLSGTPWTADSADRARWTLRDRSGRAVAENLGPRDAAAILDAVNAYYLSDKGAATEAMRSLAVATSAIRSARSAMLRLGGFAPV
ncbi:MAG: hypothetical protein QME77_13210 [bacterium]|nr:hypothetical protein [bacterium]